MKGEARFVHVVVWWTKSEIDDAEDQLIEGIERLLVPLDMVERLQYGLMVQSARDVVDCSFQVGMTIEFKDKDAHDRYMVHPQHDQFIRGYFERLCKKDRVYDFWLPAQ